MKAGEQILRQFALWLGGYHRLCQQQASELTAAGNRPAADVARPRSRLVNAALAHARREAKVPVGAIDLPAVSPSHVKPLADSDPVAIEPLAAGSGTARRSQRGGAN